MTDTVDAHTRSKIMAAISRKDTSPELLLRSGLHHMGYRFRIHAINLPGTPDIVLPKYRVAIFVNGCFWHRHRCRYSGIPRTRREFWKSKFRANKARDKKKVRELREAGWRVLTVWECKLSGDEKALESTMNRVERWIHGNRRLGEIPGLKR